MDRQKKLILVGATALLLVIMIIVLVVLAFNNKSDVGPEPTPITTIEPTITPEITPESTPTTAPTDPGQPVLPGENASPTPEETPEPTPASTPDASAPTLPGSASNSTPKPTVKSTATAEPNFDFYMPASATVGAKLSVTTSIRGIAMVEWILIKKGGVEIEVNPNSSSDVDAALTKDGGSIVFKNVGTYTLKAVAITTEGLKHTAARNIEVTAAVSTPAPGNTATPGNSVTSGFAFGLPKTAYTDTVVTVSVPAGSGAVTWSVTKDGKEIALSDAFAGKLTDDGGMIVFKSEGKYVLTGTTVNGDAYSAATEVKKRG